MNKTWTPSQREAIETAAPDVLVSAGAGSGKTAVLAERCAHLLTTAASSCDVDNLLVVTFTDAAAAEMRDRIAKALRNRLDDSQNSFSIANSSRIAEQLALLDSAAISTIHSFCRRTLNRYFAKADLDPQATLLNEYDAQLLRRKVARQAFDQFADATGPVGEENLNFIAAYDQSGEEGLISCALQVEAFLSSLTDPQSWLDSSIERATASSDTLPPYWLAELHALLAKELTDQITAVTQALQAFPNRVDGIATCATTLEDYLALLNRCQESVGTRPSSAALDRACQQIADSPFGKIPAKNTKIARVEGYAAVADITREIRDELFKKRLQTQFARFTTAEWAQGLQRTTPHLRAFIRLVQNIAKAYAAAKEAEGVIDFADLERKTYDLLRDDSNGVARRLRRQYRHVLVDEFQDINPLQRAILALLAGEDAADSNLFTVGDVKQSIYRFRLAEPRLFLARANAPAHPAAGAPTRIINLRENFRSSAAVLDAINRIFERIMVPDLGGIAYDDNAKLIRGVWASGSPDAPSEKSGAAAPHRQNISESPALELHLLEDVTRPTKPPDGETGEGKAPALQQKRPRTPTSTDSTDVDLDDADPTAAESFDWQRIEREGFVIAQRIHQLRTDGVAFESIAILMRSLKPRAAWLARTLSRLGIPVAADVGGNFFDSLEIHDILSLIALLDNEQQDIPLAAVLRSNLLGTPLTDSQLVELRTALPDSPWMPFHAAVRLYADEGPNSELRTHLQRVYDRLNHWTALAAARPFAEVLWQIYEDTSYYAYVNGLRDGPARQANLRALHDCATRLTGFERPGPASFLRFIEDIRDSDQDLNIASAVPDRDAVRIMTVHRSKGLEFDVVILAEAGKRFNMADAAGTILFDRDFGVALKAVDVDKRVTYPTLPHRLATRAARDASLAEEMRILYVAMTRAKQRIILVGTSSLENLDAARLEYANHVGPLSFLDRQRASTVLDWVLPAICAQPDAAVSLNDAATNSLIAIRTYAAAEIQQWTIDPPPRKEIEQRLAICAELGPLDDTRATNPASNADTATSDPDPVAIVAKRLTTPYRADALTRVPAVIAATALKHRWEGREEDETVSPWLAGKLANADEPLHSYQRSPDDTSGSALTPQQTALQRGVQGSALPSATPNVSEAATQREAALQRKAAMSMGTSMHQFLEHLDLSRPCDPADLAEQLAAIRQAHPPSEVTDPLIAPGAVAWFFSTDLGRRLKASPRVLREWPFVIGIDPTRYDRSATPVRNEVSEAPIAAAPTGANSFAPEDMILLRGIVDCLFEGKGEGEDGDRGQWEIIDYKTDAVTGEALNERAELYRPQLDIYAHAVTATLGAPVRGRWLVFLTARQIIEV